jgi:hypothetical protein
LLRRGSHSGSLVRRVRKKSTCGLTPDAGRNVSRRFFISICHKGICADSLSRPALSGSRENIRGASATPRVTFAPRKSLAKTLRVSGYHPPGVTPTVSLAVTNYARPGAVEGRDLTATRPVANLVISRPCAAGPWGSPLPTRTGWGFPGGKPRAFANRRALGPGTPRLLWPGTSGEPGRAFFSGR